MGRGLGQPFKREGKDGWWFRWTDPGTRKRRHRWFPNKGLADNFRSLLLYKRFADCIPGGLPTTIESAEKEYLESYDVRGCSAAAKAEARLTIAKFKESFGLLKTTAIRQADLDRFIVNRLDSGASRWTVNKDIGNLKAFLFWCRSRHYLSIEFTLKKVKVERQIKKALTTDQIRALLAACPSLAWRIRLLLSLTTGLRKNDLDGLPAASVDLKRMTLDVRAKKTGKVFVGLPLPNALRPILRKFLADTVQSHPIPSNQGKLFTDQNVRKEWDALRARAGLKHVTRKDLRVTASTLLQRIGSIGSAKTLLQHSSSRTTGEFYTDEEVVMRWKVNQMPVKEWLKPTKKGH